MVIPRDWLSLAWFAFSGFILLWDVFLAGQIAQARRQSPVFLALTAICGLFVVPASLVAMASSSILTARAIHLIGWLWPLTLGIFVLQSGFAMRRRLVTPLLSVPIFALNVLLFLAATVRYATQWLPDLPSLLIGIDAAQAGALGLLLGRFALWSPIALQVPLLAPAYPARWKVSKTVRALLALSAAVSAAFVIVEYPPAVRAARSFQELGTDRLQERPRGDFALGVRLFPSLEGPPPPLSLRHDLALADTLDVSIVSVVIAPAGTGAIALDSLANALADLRRDSVTLVVALGYGARDGDAMRISPAAYRDSRLEMVDRVMRRVRPDVLLPALDAWDAGRRALGDVPAEWWQDYYTRAAALTHRLRPRTRVGLSASAFTPRDSSLYMWGAANRGIDLIGFSFAPSYGGGASLAARLRIAQRWIRRTTKEQWVFSASGYPDIYGEANQSRAIWGTLAWATSQPRVRALIVNGAGDYDTLVGLRAPSGRLRPVVASIDRARRALEEAARENR
jgi:hypothetical protein